MFSASVSFEATDALKNNRINRNYLGSICSQRISAALVWCEDVWDTEHMGHTGHQQERRTVCLTEKDAGNTPTYSTTWTMCTIHVFVVHEEVRDAVQFTDCTKPREYYTQRWLFVVPALLIHHVSACDVLTKNRLKIIFLIQNSARVKHIKISLMPWISSDHRMRRLEAGLT